MATKNHVIRHTTPFKCSVLLIALFSSSSFASGTFLQEATYANLGVAGAGDGVYTDSAASIWTNPAIMSHIQERKSTVSGTLLNLDIGYVDGQGQENANSNSTLPIASFYHVFDINDSFDIGLAFSSPGGATLDYGSEWDGSSQLTDVALLSYQFNPSVSYLINDKWSIAAGVQFNYAYLEGATKSINLDSATDWAYGFNLGTVYQVNDSTRIGLSYRSAIEHEFSSSTSANALPNYHTSLPYAAITDLSASHQLNSKLTLMSSIQLHQWSELDSTDIYLGDVAQPLSIQRDWDDVWRASIGGQYELNNNWALKVGYAYETSPLDDPSNQSPDLPVGEQHRYSIGLQKAWSDSKWDIYYQYADFGEMDISQSGIVKDLDGHFTGQVHFIGTSYSF